MFPNLHVTINGGIKTNVEIKKHLENGMDGVMIGRAAYHNPMLLLQNIDSEIFDHDYKKNSFEIIDEMLPYIDRHIQNGGKLNQVSRHMLGIFSGQPGAKTWRQEISKYAHKQNAGSKILIQACKRVLMLQQEIKATDTFDKD
jgi:tRNA-dihydrouridine synthase A